MAFLREELPDLKIRVDQRRRSDAAAARQRTPARADATPSSTRSSRTDKPIIFAYHGYPWLIHRLTYRRTNHRNLHVRGYKEEGTITTPFDMAVLNDLDRFHLAGDAIARLPHLGARGDAVRAGVDGSADRASRLHLSLWAGHAVDQRLAMAGPSAQLTITRINC